MSPKVTVITPVYNGERYIEGAMSSLISQIFQDWELVIVDDGSSDSTPQLLAQITDPRVRIIRQQNGGEAKARNAGLDHATGEYVAFLDADDQYFTTALDDLVSFLDQHPEFDVAYSDGQICDDQDRPLMQLSEIRSGIHTGNVLENLVLSSSVITVPVCTMTRRAKIVERTVRFDPHLVIGPDWDFWIQLAVYSKFGYLDKTTCKYRVHNTNITRRVDVEKRKHDQVFGRLKVMNSSWFNDLSLYTREFFFTDLLVNIISGDAETQANILASEQFSRMPDYVRSNLWRTVGINVLQCQRNEDIARQYFHESLKINPADRKTRFLIWSLGVGHKFTLSAINTWQRSLHLAKKLTSARYFQSRRLQKLFGFR